MSHDTDGIIWPFPIAPYHVLITIMKPEQATLATEIACNLAALGIDILIDDRDERPGVKFKDADLVGFPIRIALGEKSLARGDIEVKRRGGELTPVKIEQAVAHVVQMTLAPARSLP